MTGRTELGQRAGRLTRLRQLTGLRAFTVLWVGQLASSTGTRMTNFVLGIWVWQQTGQASALALLTFFAFGATVVCSPLAGSLVDRLSRRLTIMLSDIGSAVATGLLLLVFLTGHAQLWELILTNTLTGGFLAFQYMHPDRPLFKVVVNDERQHAIWPACRDNAPGWRDAGFTGDEQQRAAYVAEVWPDIRPASVRSAP